MKHQVIGNTIDGVSLLIAEFANLRDALLFIKALHFVRDENHFEHWSYVVVEKHNIV